MDNTLICRRPRAAHFAVLLVFSLGLPFTAFPASKDARVTQLIRDVKLLPAQAEARPAVLNDQVKEGVAVRTGNASRSELTFADLTISRLGANTIFSFNKAGRGVQLDGGSILVRVPKDSGGGEVRTKAVSVAITGTTLIVETSRAGRNLIIMLEGSSRVSLRKVRGQARDLRGGQMLDVPAGATSLPMPTDADLDGLMKKHPLITGFPPLPSREAILATARDPRPGSTPTDEPVYQGQPGAGGGGPLVGLPFPGIQIGGGRGGRNPGNSQPRTPGGGGNSKPTAGGGGRAGGKTGSTSTGGVGTTGGVQTAPGGNQQPPILKTAPARRAVPKRTPTPPPVR